MRFLLSFSLLFAAAKAFGNGMYVEYTLSVQCYHVDYVSPGGGLTGKMIYPDEAEVTLRTSTDSCFGAPQYDTIDKCKLDNETTTCILSGNIGNGLTAHEPNTYLEIRAKCPGTRTNEFLQCANISSDSKENNDIYGKKYLIVDFQTFDYYGRDTKMHGYLQECPK